MTEPVGPDFGLKPQLDHTRVIPPPNSREIVSTDDIYGGTEFGGVGGLIQPPPHVPTAHERLMMVYAIDPSDTGNEPGSVTPPELEGF